MCVQRGLLSWIFIWGHPLSSQSPVPTRGSLDGGEGETVHQVSLAHWITMLPSSGQGKHSRHTGCLWAVKRFRDIWEKELQGALRSPMVGG